MKAVVKTRSKPSPRVRRTKRCEVCQEPYRTFRKDSRYCSDACKQAAYRLRKSTP